MKMENDIDKLRFLGIRFAYPSNFQLMSIFDVLDSQVMVQPTLNCSVIMQINRANTLNSLRTT